MSWLVSLALGSVLRDSGMYNDGLGSKALPGIGYCTPSQPISADFWAYRTPHVPMKGSLSARGRNREIAVSVPGLTFLVQSVQRQTSDKLYQKTKGEVFFFFRKESIQTLQEAAPQSKRVLLRAGTAKQIEHAISGKVRVVMPTDAVPLAAPRPAKLYRFFFKNAGTFGAIWRAG